MPTPSLLRQITEVVTDDRGNGVTGAIVYIYDDPPDEDGSGGVLSILYDENGVPVGNPVTTFVGKIVNPIDPPSKLAIFMGAGKYTMRVEFPYLPTEMRELVIADEIGSLLAGWKYAGFGIGGYGSLGISGGPYMFSSTSPGIAASGAASTGGWPFYIDPAMIDVPGKTTEWALLGSVRNNSVKPNLNITFMLNKTTAFGGAASSAVSATIDTTPVAGSPVTITDPPASQGVTVPALVPFHIVTAGFYVCCYTQTATPAATSTPTARVVLMYRHVN